VWSYPNRPVIMAALNPSHAAAAAAATTTTTTTTTTNNNNNNNNNNVSYYCPYITYVIRQSTP